MSHYDSYSYDRSDRLFDERDPYGGAAVGYADRGIKRQRSHTPAFDDTYHGSSEREWEHKRRRSRDDFERDWGSTTERSPERGRRSWNELDPKEKEREWRMYERERDIEKEWDRYYAGQGVVDERDARSRSHREERRTPEDGFRNADDSLARERQARPTDSLKDPMDSRTILTFKRFAQLLRENGKEPAAGSNSMEATQLLYEKYQEYRKAFQRRAMEQFFETHKNAPWFNEKFGISQEVAEAKAARRRQGRNGKRKLWLNDLRSGTLDRINFDVIETREPRKGKDAFAQQSGSSKYFVATNQAGEREELDEIESVVLAPEPNQLLIRSIPAEIGRSSIEDALKGEKGFLYLALGEPHPLKRYGRVGCAVFEHQSADTMLDIALRLSQTTIEGQKLAFELANRPAQVKLRVAPEYACSLPRLLHDLHQARKVLQLFESEDRQEMQKAGNVNAFAEEELDLEATSEIEQRALHVTCSDGTNAEEMKLWLSNVLDLRSGRGSETASPPENDDANINKALLGEDEEDCEAVQTKQELLRKNLDLHLDLLRKVYNCDYYSSTVSDFPEELSRRAPRCLRFNCAKPMTHLSAIAEKAKLWASNVDTKHELLMRPDDNQIGNYGGIDIKSMLIDLAAPYSREDETEKHRCIVKVNGEECGKPFKAQIFVQKHVTNKHKEWFNELMADKIDDAKFYNNYVRDPQRPMPIAQPTDRNGISTSGNPSSLGSRLGGYDHSNAAQLSAGGNGYYGGGNLVRLGLSSAAEGAGDYARDRAGDAIASGTSLRMGKIDSDPFSVSSAVPNVNRVRLDPRAAMAPKSYRDLDAGVPSGAAEIELEY